MTYLSQTNVVFRRQILIDMLHYLVGEVNPTSRRRLGIGWAFHGSGPGGLEELVEAEP